MASLFKKTGKKLELLADIGMLLMVEKRIRGGMCHAIHRYAKTSINIGKIMIKASHHHTLCI